ncbi:MAG: acyl-[acyl-carrier-protein] thioesterase [Bdellovibrionota bacterium]
MNFSTTKKYEVKSYEVDANNKMKPYALLHDLEDVASTNAKKLGVGYSKTQTLNVGWFLIKYHLKFEKFPDSLDTIYIKTWAIKSKGIYCRREFNVQDENYKNIGAASSLWVLVDLETKKILNPYKELSFPELEEKYALETSFPKIPPLEKVDIQKDIEIGFDDIDLNRHVNNSNYLKFVLNTLSFDFLLKTSIKEIEINYKKEVKIDDIIIVETEFKDNNITLHNIKNKKTNEDLTSFRILWSGN